MRLPDPRLILDAPRRVLVDFPWTGLSALVLCCSLCALNHLDGHDADQFLSRLSMAAGWGISLTFLVGILSRKMPLRSGFLPQLVPVAILWLWFILVEHPLGMAQVSQFTLLGVATHLAVSLANGTDEAAFWQWNRTLFQRAIEAFAFTAVLGAGASGALWTLENLFSIDLPHGVWGDLWIFLWSIFATFHFLSGIARDGVGADGAYPTYLKMFSTRVLLPLAMVYLVLLYLYMAKIVVTWSLPMGLVCSPILAFAGFGILARLLLDPLASLESDRWIRLWMRWFQVLLLPLCVLLAVAIGRRLLDYGLTEERYAVVVLAIWLPVQAIWFLVGRRSLGFVPASLMVLCLLCGWGPWGAFESSRRAQIARLDGMLSEIGVVPGGMATKEVPRATAKRIGGVVEYLCEHHQGRGLEKWSSSVSRLRKQTDEKESNRYNANSMADSVMRSMGVPHVNRWDREDPDSLRVTLRWPSSLRADFAPRTHLLEVNLHEPSNFTTGMRVRVVREGVVNLFVLEALPGLVKSGESWMQLDSSLVVHDSSGSADLILRSARLERDRQHGWHLKSLEGILLR